MRREYRATAREKERETDRLEREKTSSTGYAISAAGIRAAQMDTRVVRDALQSKTTAQQEEIVARLGGALGRQMESHQATATAFAPAMAQPSEQTVAAEVGQRVIDAFKEQAQTKRSHPEHARAANSRQNAILQCLAVTCEAVQCEPCAAESGLECAGSDENPCDHCLACLACEEGKCSDNVTTMDRRILTELGLQSGNGAERLGKAKKQRPDPGAPVGSAERAVRSDSKEANPTVVAVVRQGWEECSTHRPEEKNIATCGDGFHRASATQKPEKRDRFFIVGKGAFFVANYIAKNTDLMDKLRGAGVDGCPQSF